MAKLKFDLKIGDERIRSIQDLKDNFDEEEVLEIYKNNKLSRWLDAWDFDEYLANVKNIDTTEDKYIVECLIDIFDIERCNKSDFDKLLDKAGRFYEKDLFEEALEVLKKAQLLEPEDDEVMQKIEACKEALTTTQEESQEASKLEKKQEKKELEEGYVIAGGFKIIISNTITEMTFSDTFLYNYKDSITEVKIPDSVTSIGFCAFYNCSRLEEVKIPDSVTSIGNSAFDGCSSLTEITIPDSVTSIGDYAFDGCSSLEEITIPNRVTSIGNYAFRECSRLEEVKIPDSVTSVGDGAFGGCSSLHISAPKHLQNIDWGWGARVKYRD